MPSSLRTQRMMRTRRESVRRMYNAWSAGNATAGSVIDNLSIMHGVSKATIYKDLKATGKEAKR